MLYFDRKSSYYDRYQDGFIKAYLEIRFWAAPDLYYDPEYSENLIIKIQIFLLILVHVINLKIERKLQKNTRISKIWRCNEFQDYKSKKSII